MKHICLILAALLLLTACGGQTEQPTTVTTVPTTTAPAPTAAPLAVGETAENDAFAITLAAVDGESLSGYTMTLQVKNKTDKALRVELDSLTVNDCVSHKQWETELPALATVESTISIVDDSFMHGGETEIKKVEMFFTLWEGETELADGALWSVFYSGGDAGWTATPYTPDLVLVENEDLTIGMVGYDPADPLGYGVLLYLENKTGDDLLFDLGEVKVDNSPCQPLFAGAVPAGKRSYALVSWYLADLQKLGIGDPAKLELPFTVYDTDDHLKAPLLEETFELLPVWE